MWHWANYFLHGDPYDRTAARGLAGYLGKEEIIAQKSLLGAIKGGKKAAPALNSHPNTKRARLENLELMLNHPNTAANRSACGRETKNHLLLNSSPLSQKNNNERKKPVLCLETGEVFESINAAARSRGASKGAVYKSCKNGGKAGGFHWQFI
jgi:hypothetical protein